MNSQIYVFLNIFLHPIKFRVLLSLLMLFFTPIAADFWLLAQKLIPDLGTEIALLLEFASVLVGYGFAFFAMDQRLKHAKYLYSNPEIQRLVGSYPSFLFLLSPGIIGFFIGLFLLLPFTSRLIGIFIMRIFNLDARIIYNIINLNYTTE